MQLAKTIYLDIDTTVDREQAAIIEEAVNEMLGELVDAANKADISIEVSDTWEDIS